MQRHRNPDGTYNGLGVMSELTGLSRQTMQDLAAQVRANHGKLSACPHHNFVAVPGSATPSGLCQRYRCTWCEGEIDHHAWYWHEQGRRPKPADCSS